MTWRSRASLALGVSIVMTSSLLAGLVVKWTGHHFPRDELARTEATLLAEKITSEWANDHPDRPCPRFLDELGQLVADPWGRDYHLECRGDEVWITSAGPDQRFGTLDDITVHWSRR